MNPPSTDPSTEPLKGPSTEMVEIPVDQCLAMLAMQEIGRIAVVRDGFPMIFPVNYVAQGADILFRTAAGSPLIPNDGEAVSFEVDHIDHEHRNGWSIIVRGTAAHDGAAGGSDPAPEPWASGPRPIVVRVRSEGQITGRWLRTADLQRFDSSGYL